MCSEDAAVWLSFALHPRQSRPPFPCVAVVMGRYSIDRYETNSAERVMYALCSRGANSLLVPRWNRKRKVLVPFIREEYAKVGYPVKILWAERAQVIPINVSADNATAWCLPERTSGVTFECTFRKTRRMTTPLTTGSSHSPPTETLPPQ